MFVRSKRRAGGRKWVGAVIIQRVELRPAQEDIFGGAVLEKGLEALRKKIIGD
jgi:hypothetical protein